MGQTKNTLTLNLPLVSAIITTHNRLDLLKRAVESVYAQTYRNIELIVVDDGSSDGTKDYCMSLDVKYIRINPKDSKGGNYARNLGIKAARGEYVAFLDDDDYWLPNKTTLQLELILNKNCELVHGGRILEIVNDKDFVYKKSLPNPEWEGFLEKKILYGICTTTSLILVKKSALIDIGLFDENLRFWQEYELTIRLAQRRPFYFINEPVTVYRIDGRDPNRLTNKFYEWKESVNYIYHKHKELYASLTFNEKIKVHRLYWSDGSNRAKRVGLIKTYYFYMFLLRLTTPPQKIFYYLKNKFFNEKSL